MNELYLVGGMALVTFLIRYPVLAMSGRIKFPPRLLQILGYVPAAVLTAIVVPAVLMPTENQLLLSYVNPRLVGAIAAILVGFWRNNLLLTIVVGMLVFFGWQGLLAVTS
jgi:branched-subunit amino acid transport protein